MGKYGLKIKPCSTRKYDYRQCVGSKAIGNQKQIDLPKFFELNMRSFCDIKNQKLVSSCVAFACSIVAECEQYKRIQKKEEISTGNTYGSEACRKGYLGPGMYLDDTLNGLTKIGFVPNIFFNVNIEMPRVYNMLKNRTDLIEQGQLLKPTGYASLMNGRTSQDNIQSMKEAIYTYQCPLVMVSYDFFKEPHCVVLTGWNEKNEFKYQNSWGIEDGEGFIPYDRIEDACILFFEELQLPFEDISPNDWFYQELKNVYFSGLIENTAENKFIPNGNIKRGDSILFMDKILNKFEKSLNSYFKTKEAQGYSVSYLTTSVNKRNFKFNDVADDIYYSNAINNIASLGLINSDENNNFYPENNITRAQFATIIVRLYDYLLAKIDGLAEWISFPKGFGYDNPIVNYKDVQEKNTWYYDFVNAATELGIMQGFSDECFYPNNAITRAEAVYAVEKLCQKVDTILKRCAD